MFHGLVIVFMLGMIDILLELETESGEEIPGNVIEYWLDCDIEYEKE